MNKHNQISRRHFLRRTGSAGLGITAGLALPNLFLNHTKAATGENPSEAIRVGFVAVGGRGMQNAGFFMKRKMISAICDVDKSILAKSKATIEKAQGNEVTAYGDYRKLLEDKKVDAVLISTPDHWHTMPAIHACQAGKDVYCEKPLTLFIEEGKSLVKVVRDHKRVFQTGSQQRSDPRFRTAVEMLRLGKLGKVHTVQVGIPRVNWDAKLDNTPDSEPPAELDYDMWLGPAPKRPYNKARVHYFFRFFWDYSGGQMTNWGAHHLDIAQWGLDMDNSGPVEISGQGKFDEQKRYEVCGECRITYSYANGVKMILRQDPKATTGTTFIGDKGALHVNRGVLKFGATEAELDDIPPMKVEEIKNAYISNDHYQNWLDCIKSRKDPICKVEVGHRTATVCHLGNIAVRTGKTIKWDPAKEVIVGDAELAKWANRPYRAPWVLPPA
jgi:predicted dehydrogenase